jgi:hypothetical protein
LLLSEILDTPFLRERLKKPWRERARFQEVGADYMETAEQLSVWGLL